MKELVLNAGGRRLYNEDLMDIQEHLISIQSIFASDAPFVLTGLDFNLVSGTTTTYDITPAVIWLGGKIRTYAGTTNIDLNSSQYLNVSDSTTSSLHDDNVTRVVTDVFGVALSGTPVAGNSNFLRIDEIDSIRRYYENVIGDKYLKLNYDQTQTVVGDLVLQKSVTSSATITTTASISANSIISSDSISANGEITCRSINVIEDSTIGGNSTVFGSITSNQNISAVGKVQATTSFSIGAQVVINSNAEIHNSRVVTDSIADLNVTSWKLAANSVTGSKIATGAVTNNALATDSVGGSAIQFGAVTEDKIADNAVTGDKILDGAVSQDSLNFNTFKVRASGNFTTAHLSGQATLTQIVNTGVSISTYNVIYEVSGRDGVMFLTHNLFSKNNTDFGIALSKNSGTPDGKVTVKWIVVNAV